MAITISLPPGTEQKLRQRAAESGLDPDAYARRLIEQGLNEGAQVPPADQASQTRPAAAKLGAILAPFRQEVQESGMTDDALREFFSEVRDEVRADKRAGQPQGPAGG